VVGADVVAHPKPAPDLVEEGLKRLGVGPGAAVLVGDSRYDVAAGRVAGVRVVGLRIDADQRIEKLAELPATLAIRTVDC
jgi:beta-phosphoglucomutase-like phosphatase (HAD superfamily)